MSARETIHMPGAYVDPKVDANRAPAGDLTQEMLEHPLWTDQMLASAGIPVIDVPLVSLGGGIGSFVLTDYLRIAGVPKENIRVLSAIDKPWSTYQHLTTVSQIPPAERLRSDSGSCPDNIWGFPSYAVREAFGNLPNIVKFLDPLWNVFSEPILTNYFTPKAGQVFAGMQTEADRIGWWSMVSKGQIRMARKRYGGGYFSILTPPEGTSETKRVAYRSTFVHVAIGYPGLRYLPDLQEYRQKYQDYVRPVNAYEPHEHVYQELIRRPGTVVVRGGGIAASRILQRLIDDRDNHGAKTQIAHLFRTYVKGTTGPNIFYRRPGGDGWSYQGFNWPKAGWGGQHKFKLEKLDEEGRKKWFADLGGTTTPKRKLWMKQLERGRKEGFYKTYVGKVTEVVPGPDDTVLTRIKTDDGSLEIPAHFIIDCTGLEADIREHRVLADLLDYGGATKNVLGKLAVDKKFEIIGARSDNGRMYAVGSATLGSYYTVVDSFLGLQYAGLTIMDELAKQGFCNKLGPVRSTAHWWKWVLNRKLP
jgi:hypothetical protein